MASAFARVSGGTGLTASLPGIIRLVWITGTVAMLIQALAASLFSGGKSVRIHGAFQSFSSNKASSKLAGFDQAVSLPSWSHDFTRHHACCPETSGLPAYSTRWDWPETIFRLSQRSASPLVSFSSEEDACTW